METIVREIYLNRITRSLDRGVMIFLVGQRRVGKSFMLRQLEDWIGVNIPEANVLHINMENVRYTDISTYKAFYDYVDVRLVDGKKNYLLVDEVQNVEHYEYALRSLYAEEKCQIVATGSNAYIFASELSTHLSGRYIEIPVYGLTYGEFLVFHKLEDSEQSLLKYMEVGGLPGLRNFDIDDNQQVYDYLQGVYSTVLLKDVINRNSIRNTNFMQRLTHFLADNTGKIISPGSIGRFMKSQNVKISDSVISDYIVYLCKALLIDEVRRYDIHGKHIFESLGKYYYTDIGIRNLICGFDIRSSIEKIIENVVYNHLLVRGYKVSVGILKAGEIDFVATKPATSHDDERIYVQCVYLLGSEETIKREFGNLASINDNFPKYVVSMDPVTGQLVKYPGIKHLSLREFLKLQ